jgi:hypothetical protein
MNVLLTIGSYDRTFVLTGIVVTLRNNSIPKGGMLCGLSNDRAFRIQFFQTCSILFKS